MRGTLSCRTCASCTDITGIALIALAALKLSGDPVHEPVHAPRLAPVRSASTGPWAFPPVLNARYHTALRLAELVLRATSAEHAAGTVAVNGFLIGIPQMFEDFVTVALREAIEGPYGGRIVGQPRHYLDEADRVLLKPDIVWRVGGKAAAVIDAKYKAEKPSGFPNADLYQLLAYCMVLGLRVATSCTRRATSSQRATSSAGRVPRSSATL
jgi:hypothetical protein